MSESIAVALPSEIVYVYGTVNGAVVTWTRYGIVWTATAPRAENGVYGIVLSAFDTAGNHTDYQVTLQYGLWLITDRTAFDVAYAAAHRDAAEALKGAYNASDLNRVEMAVRYIADFMQAYGYTAPVETFTDWRVTDVPRETDMARYLGNVRTLIDAFQTLPTTPAPPNSMTHLTHTKANDIEQILLDIYALLINMTKAWFFSGEIFTGEEW